MRIRVGGKDREKKGGSKSKRKGERKGERKGRGRVVEEWEEGERKGGGRVGGNYEGSDGNMILKMAVE